MWNLKNVFFSHSQILLYRYLNCHHILPFIYFNNKPKPSQLFTFCLCRSFLAMFIHAYSWISITTLVKNGKREERKSFSINSSFRGSIEIVRDIMQEIRFRCRIRAMDVKKIFPELDIVWAIDCMDHADTNWLFETKIHEKN